MSELKIRSNIDYTPDNTFVPDGPLAPDNTLEKSLSLKSGIDRGTIRGMLNAEEAKEKRKQLENPRKYAYVKNMEDITTTAINNVKRDIEKSPSPDDMSGGTTEQAPGHEDFDMGSMDGVADYGNQMEPDFDEVDFDDDFDAGSVNGDDDMTNTSLDTINSIDDDFYGDSSSEGSYDDTFDEEVPDEVPDEMPDNEF